VHPNAVQGDQLYYYSRARNLMEKGVITNYKYYEDENTEIAGHFYEITIEEDEKCYYAKTQIGDSLAFGTEVSINPISREAHAHMTNYPFQVTGPYNKTLNTINYQGFVIDCLDSDIGVYNLDNEIILFGSACLDLPIGINVTLFNLHLIQVIDMNRIFKLFGSTLKKSHILVYCPAFSSYLEGSDKVSYDNLIDTKTNLSSLIYANKWLKDNFKFDFPGFQSLDHLASILFSETQSKGGAQFIGHCEECIFTQNFTESGEYPPFRRLLTAQDVKSSFHKIKAELLDSNFYSNQTLSKYLWMRNDIIHGIFKRKNSVLFDIISGDEAKTVSIFSNESNGFNPPDGSFCLILNAIQIVEIVPKLRASDSWTTKAYLWISPETKIWSPSDYFWTSSLSFSFSCPSGFVLCKIVRKYLILKEFDQKQYETAVIHIESERGPHTFYLNPNEKYYGIISTPNEEGILSIRHCIDEIYFKDSNEPLILPSSGIVPILSCTLNVDEQILSKGPLQVRINDLRYLSLIKSLQFFSLKLRFYSISSLSLRLVCSKCKSQIEGNRCLSHLEDYTPVLTISAVFEVADLDGSSTTTVLIDRFSFFEIILGTKAAFKNDLLNLLKFSGKIKLKSEHFAFSNNFKVSTDAASKQLEETISNLIPRVSRVMNCTFPSNMANSVLKPINLEYSDPRLELINILKLF
jgi:hypothetical protein